MTAGKKPALFETDEGALIVAELERMAKDAGYTTTSSYAANSDLYPDNTISFVQKHKEYLRTHPATDPQMYLSNLRLMTRKK